MFKKILIANRGEIALRIIWACKELGIKTVAVYSEADRDALHVKFADESICIGPPKSGDSYLNIASIISAAEVTGAEAIHPGYGFLAENPQFAEVCDSCGITFIGPSAEVIKLMGNKSEARKLMSDIGVPVTSGSKDTVSSVKEAAKIATKIGYPIMLKASAGGGGRGMRIVYSEDELPEHFKMAQVEAEAAFGDPSLYVEKYVEHPRHIEFQIIGDLKGNIVHLGERECSIQRRHQKLVEESPSPALDERLRAEIAEAAITAAKAVQYFSVGTVEFLLDSEKNFYFMEMNTRIQVEHPVTEMVTGIDLVKEQIRIAAGKKLSFSQKDVRFIGHSIECRINAEDPKTMIPSPGRITGLYLPTGPGIRVDTAAYAGYQVPPYYDSLLAKLISYGRDRKEAINRMKRALEATIVEGLKTNVRLHQAIISHPDFVAGNLDTGFLNKVKL
ncbi:MAG: acetyl-CoA carboxylase biotin carboxylase subunit [Acidobacteria bacterium]|nr:acetyl-CoA carboxylase biotin carboxylase subunit [Acidobacteriota bacterium]